MRAVILALLAALGFVLWANGLTPEIPDRRSALEQCADHVVEACDLLDLDGTARAACIRAETYRQCIVAGEE